MEIQPTLAVAETVIKIMVELLGVLALATRQINQGSSSKLQRSFSWQLIPDPS